MTRLSFEERKERERCRGCIVLTNRSGIPKDAVGPAYISTMMHYRKHVVFTCIAISAVLCFSILYYATYSTRWPFAVRPLYQKIVKSTVETRVNVANTADQVASIHALWTKHQHSLPTPASFLLNTSENDKRTFCETKPFLIYYCKSSYCGGLGDRQRGIVSTYLLSLLLQRHYAIVMNRPCPLSTFMTGNGVSWDYCKEYLDHPSSEDVVYGFVDRGGWNSYIPKTFYESPPTQRRLYVKTNSFWLSAIRKHPNVSFIIPWMTELSDGQVISRVIKKLLRPKQHLHNDIQSILAQTNNTDRLVCSHIRITRNPSLPKDDVKVGRSNETIITQFLKSMVKSNTDVLFIASDSEDVKNRVYASLGGRSVRIRRPIVHVDRFDRQDIENACEGFYTVLLEQTLLSKCDVLVISWSGLSLFSAFLRGNSNNLFCYSAMENAVVPCVLYEMFPMAMHRLKE